MLVFQRDWEHIEAGCERAGIKTTWLVETVAMINLYLPDDWRMTRSSNNFRIQVVGPDELSLVGFCYRLGENEIINIIDTIFPKGFFDQFDLREKMPVGKGQVKRSVKKKAPEILHPNLYFFRPCPDDSPTPLFARQYEKIKMKADSPVGDQYHRIHPLTRNGLDLGKCRWVHWDITGHIEPTDSIEQNYHGKSYWEVPEFTRETRRGRLEEYLSNYRKKVEETGERFEAAESPSSPYEREFKLIIPGDENTARECFTLIDEQLRAVKKGTSSAGFFGTDFRQVEKQQTKEQRDIYFDDENYTLHAVGASFRLRKGTKTTLVTLKKRIPAARGILYDNLYDRIEEEAEITTAQAESIRAGKEVNVLPYRLIHYIAPYRSALKPVLTVENKRTITYLSDLKNRQAELCYDRVYYQFGDLKIGPFFEIEIESKGAPREQIEQLAHALEEAFGLIPSLQSKYERGISLLRILHEPKGRKKIIIDTDCGVDDALALILAVKSPELELRAITTVSGNVHVDKVTPNVMKVLNALKVEHQPIVARGEEWPLSGSSITADSVHGNDGLGDATEPLEGWRERIHGEPAWKVICDLARQYRKEITLVTIGPLTNLARAIQQDPGGVRCLKEIVSMGGVFFEVGNVSADAEFNVAADPEAAKIVVEFCRDSCRKKAADEKPEDRDAQVPLTFVGLDVTHKVMLRRKTLARLRKGNPGNQLLKFIENISAKYMDFYKANEDLPGCYLHDPLAVAYVINPSFLKVEKHIINVETRGQFTSGMIFPDDRPTRNPAWRDPSLEVIGIARSVEREAFEEEFLRRICC